jgi:hypothetical protein
MSMGKNDLARKSLIAVGDFLCHSHIFFDKQKRCMLLKQVKKVVLLMRVHFVSKAIDRVDYTRYRIQFVNCVIH